MQKLLIHINILLAFTVLFCSHSAYGQSGIGLYVNEKKVDSRAVDLGLPVYWAKYNVGANDSTDSGGYFPWPTQNWSDSKWPNWRIPTKDEVNNLINQCTYSFENDGVKITTNGKSILIPKSSFKDRGNYQDTYKNLSYFWTSTASEYFLDNRAYRFQGGKFTSVIKPFLVSDRASVEARSYLRNSELPLRPVIDKVSITLRTSDGGTTITKYYPIGTIIEIGAFWDECHKVASWTETKSSNSSPKTITDINGDNGYKQVTITEDVTYIANFEKKKYSVSAYKQYGDSEAEYSMKIGNLECGQETTISVPIDNCYVFQGWEGPGITGRLAAGENNNGYSCQLDNSVSPAQAKLTIPNIDSNTQLNRDYTAIFSIKTTNIRATTDSSKGWVGLNVWK